jgi:hypothetical protein
MRFEDDDPILDTREKIATVRQTDFRAKRRGDNKPAIFRHFDTGLSHGSPEINAI